MTVYPALSPLERQRLKRACAELGKPRMVSRLAPRPRRASSSEPYQNQTYYLEPAVTAELEREAVRLERSVSWIVQRCVRSVLPALREQEATP